MDQYCDFEWVSRGSGVEQIGCDFPKGKVDFIGDYGKHECGLRVHHLDAKDRGIWQCEVEKYYMGFSRRSVLTIYITFLVTRGRHFGARESV
jgi:hypothetical protein